MRRVLPAVFALIFPVCSAFAQFDVESAKRHVIIKYSPLPMYDFDNTIQFGVEIPLGKGNFALQEDLGYGNSSFNLWFDEDDDRPERDIYKSRTHLKWYFLERRRMRAYVGPEVLYKKVVYRQNQWIGRDCQTEFGPCSFFENKDVRQDKNVWAGHARFGWQFITPGRFIFDVFAGVGFRSIHVRSRTAGVADWEVRNMYDNWETIRAGHSDLRPSMVAGFHLGLVLGKYRRE
ncbi:hypothetical protein SAMN04487996_102381 [Dyadobacter soli]|uniref:DUF3575 domain-containing protein n=1 Tax=Dyadobacter soli TaxID=659014 RepID=A0A1G6Y8H2_9BACT|nr:hypothetical protein [Dyadobacter soli]SDD86708.1 hypothetical protein SAMN04487996_102381 [Dyadobacter soli]